MNVSSATDSGLALRIRHMLNGKMRSMGAGLRVIAAVLLCGLGSAMLPTAGVAQTRDRDADTDNGERKTAAHFEELNRKIRAAIDAGKLTPEEGRAKLREARIWHAAMATDPSEWSEELKAMILELKPNSAIEEIAEGIRQRQAAGTRLTDFSQLLIELSTVAEQTSWGEIKKDVGAAE